MKKLSILVSFLILLAIVLVIRDTGLYNKKLSIYKQFQIVEDELMMIDHFLVKGEQIYDQISLLKKENRKDQKTVSLIEKGDALLLRMDEAKELFKSRKQQYLSLVHTYNTIPHPIFLHKKAVPENLSIHEFKSNL
jgi:hypothetical protein